jgi:chromate transporter
MVTVLASAYVRFGAIPQVAGLLYGIKPVVIAVVAQALWGLAPKAIKKSFWLGALGLLAYVAFALDAGALLVLLGGGVASVLASRLANKKIAAHSLAPSIFGGLAVGGASVLAPVSLVTLFLTFLRVGGRGLR